MPFDSAMNTACTPRSRLPGRAEIAALSAFPVVVSAQQILTDNAFAPTGTQWKFSTGLKF